MSFVNGNLEEFIQSLDMNVLGEQRYNDLMLGKFLEKEQRSNYNSLL